MVFGEFGGGEEVFGGGEASVGDVFVEWHTAFEGVAAEDSGSEDAVIEAVADHGGHGGYEQGSVLVIGVDHDDDVGVVFESDSVAAFLVGAVAGVDGVAVDDGVGQGAGDFGGFVAAGVVDDDDEVDALLGGDFAMGFDQRVLGVIGRHDYRDFFVVVHVCLLGCVYGVGAGRGGLLRVVRWRSTCDQNLL